MGFFKAIKVDDINMQILQCTKEQEIGSIVLNSDVTDLVNRDLEAGKTVYYNTIDYSINIGKPSRMDFGVTSSRKIEASIKLKNKLLKYNDLESLIDMIFYIDATMTLFEAGYIITDKNREEKYIEIIESEDEDLIELLEQYLTIKDDISKIKWHKSEYIKNIKKLKELPDNSEELENFIKNI